jgi:glutamine---fructose-6-phosphate transaminase (isomerizing)
LTDKSLKGNFTREEIASQIDSWEKIYIKIQSGDFKAGDQIFKNHYDSIILFGCGSSYNLAMSAAFYTNFLTDNKAIAVPSSELLFNKEAYIKKNKKYLLVGFSRSGETTESINVVKNLQNIPNLIFTCREKNSLTEISEYSFYCDGAEEKSVVMTKSFSSMLFAFSFLLAKVMGISNLVKEFKELIDYMNIKTAGLFNIIDEFIKTKSFDKFFSLGSGFNYGLAVEADLKTKEMTQIPSYSYHVMEFNHGPKSLVDNGGLILFMTVNSYFTDSIFSMYEDFSKLGSEIVLIGNNDYKKNPYGKITRVLPDESFKSDLIRAFINIPVFQIMSYYKTLSLGLDPDKPRNLDYTTKMN